ncbi:MAG: hypothetical protein PF690_15525 [Deltaproteobacteria bacterium]|jgi:uracil-DNA glycosylase|nr:hypothetical protein [Deltaproteobacteria bacterium]
MDAGVQNESLLVKKEFINVLKDFSQYLLQQKQRGNNFFEISKKSETKVNNWGLNWGSRDVAQENFFFQGPENAKVFILDSSTGFFKDKSGELLIKILAAMKLATDSVFICNADNSESVNTKIKTILPKVIITLGEKAGQSLLKIQQPLEKFQGRFHEYYGIKVMPTFHPSLLLKKPEFKRQVWEDMQQVMEYAGTRHG